jgi:hypothetical protein
MKPILLFLFAVLMGMITACQPEVTPILRETTGTTYQPGQIWSFAGRPGEESAFLVITKVEESVIGDETKVIVHVYIDGVEIEHPAGGVIKIIPHMPFTEAALNRSLIYSIDISMDLPAYESSYEKWREAYLNGKAEVFDISVRAALDSLEWSLQSSAGG